MRQPLGGRGLESHWGLVFHAALKGKVKRLAKALTPQDSNLESLAPEADALSIGPAGLLTRECGRSAGGEDTQSKGKVEWHGESCVQALGLMVPSLRSGVWFCLLCFRPEPVPR